MRNRPIGADLVLLGFGMIYPALVFFLHGTVPSAFLVILALALIGVRLLLRGGDEASAKLALAAVAIVLPCVALVDVDLATRAYPVLMSLAAAFIFGVTLRQPASLVERIALARGNAWSRELRAYCRNVTVAWTVWLVLNALVAASLAVSGDERAWALWTGLFSYLLSAALFVVEWTIRQPNVGRVSR